MKKVDYLIVGGGYAAYFFAHRLIRDGKSFLLFDPGLDSASRISAGIVNPVVLKKFTTFWLAMEQIDSLRSSLDEMKQYLNKELWIGEPVLRIFHDDNERNLWLKKCTQTGLSDFLSDKIQYPQSVINPFGCGVVKHSGRLSVLDFFKNFSDYLRKTKNLVEKQFMYDFFDVENSVYNGISFNNIVFCEGIAVKDNPWFKNIPVNPNKGHQLTVDLPGFNSQHTLKKKHFLFPLSNDSYYYGGTYDRHSQDAGIDDAAVLELEKGLQEITSSQYTVSEINVGFRPTVADRRPIIGKHPDHDNLYVFNGLGARGILNGNFFAEELYRHIEYGEPLRPEVDVRRFL